MAGERLTGLVDGKNVERATGMVAGLMKAEGESINMLEWMQALRSLHAVLGAQVGENAAALAQKRLDESRRETEQ